MRKEENGKIGPYRIWSMTCRLANNCMSSGTSEIEKGHLAHLAGIGHMDSLPEFLEQDGLQDGPAEAYSQDLSGRAKQIGHYTFCFKTAPGDD